MLAYLISAYRDPQHLRALIETLDYKTDFYVHIDANVDAAPFRTALPDRVHFVPSHRVSWGGWEQVEYQYELMRAALEAGKDYTHLVCLSAQDYPLWSNERIHDFFDRHAGEQFMAGYDLTRTVNQEQRHKFTHLHPYRDLPWKNVWLKNKVIVASRHLLGALGIRREPQVKIGGKDCDIYFGSDYWAVTTGMCPLPGGEAGTGAADQDLHQIDLRTERNVSADLDVQLAFCPERPAADGTLSGTDGTESATLHSLRCLHQDSDRRGCGDAPSMW